MLTLCKEQTWLLWPLICVFAVWRTTSFSIMFTSVMLLINNRCFLLPPPSPLPPPPLPRRCSYAERSASSKTIGLVNGISQVPTPF